MVQTAGNRTSDKGSCRTLLSLVVVSLLLGSGCRSLQVTTPLPAADDDWIVGGGSASRTNAAASPEGEMALERRWTRKAPAGFGPGSPVGAGGIVFIGTLKGEVVALRLRDGRGVGKRRFGRALTGALLLDERTVYLPNAWGRKVLAAHDLRTGRSRWERSGVPIEAGLLLTDTLLIAADIEAKVWGLSRRTGAVRWQTSGDPRHGVFSSPVLAAEVLVTADDRGLVRALHAATGHEIWQSDIGEPVLADLSTNGSDVFAPTTRGSVVALRLADGGIRWRFEIGNPRVRLTAVALRDSVLFFGGSDGSVRALDIRTGTERWRHQLGATVSAPPLVVGETVIVGAHNKTVYGLAPLDGRLLWTTAVEGVVKSAMAVHRGHLIVLSEPRHIHAFRIIDAPHSPVDS